MSKNWLFLRGSWDCRTQKSIDDDDDAWLQLFDSLVSGTDYGMIWFNSEDNKTSCFPYGKNTSIYKGVIPYSLYDTDYVFARGGFPYYDDILKRCPKAFKIYYGAGRRFFPPTTGFTDYDLILVDTEDQKKRCKSIYPNIRCELFIKPAARHFKPVECEKEYDVCYIANGQQASFKGVQWVYETVPKELEVLHLGYPSIFTPPDNVTCKRVDRIDMPRWISKCKVGVVPYDDVDSCPRALVEMIACGLEPVCLETVNINGGEVYPIFPTDRETFWYDVKQLLEQKRFLNIDDYYEEHLSIPVASKHLKELIP